MLHENNFLIIRGYSYLHFHPHLIILKLSQEVKRLSCAVVVLVAVLLATPDLVLAQTNSIAFRQGVGFWFIRNGIGKGTVHYPAGQHFTWNKELVYQHTSSGRWAVEAGIKHYTIGSEAKWRDGQTDYTRNSYATYIQIPISVQYDVTYPLLGMFFPQFAGARSYIGFLGAPGMSFEKVDKNRKEDYGATSRYSWKENDISFMVGFTYRHHVPITKRLSLSSMLTFQMNPFQAHFRKTEGDIAPNRNITFQTGIAYLLDKHLHH